MSYTISNSLTNGSYLTTNSTISLVGSGIYTISGSNYSTRSINVKYSQTGLYAIYRGQNKPVYTSESGRVFIFVMSKNGLEYKKYLK